MLHHSGRTNRLLGTPCFLHSDMPPPRGPRTDGPESPGSEGGVALDSPRRRSPRGRLSGPSPVRGRGPVRLPRTLRIAMAARGGTTPGCSAPRPAAAGHDARTVDARRGRPATQGPTTSVLTATTLIYTIGAGITAGAGTRLVLQSILANGFKLCPFQSRYAERTAPVRVVTTSPCRKWVICAPAAFLGSGSRLSGSLSGIEP